MKQIKINNLKTYVIRKFRSDGFCPLKYYQQTLIRMLSTDTKPVSLDDDSISELVADQVSDYIWAYDVRCMRGFLTEFHKYLPSGLTAGTFKGVDLAEDDWVVFY